MSSEGRETATERGGARAILSRWVCWLPGAAGPVGHRAGAGAGPDDLHPSQSPAGSGGAAQAQSRWPSSCPRARTRFSGPRADLELFYRMLGQTSAWRGVLTTQSDLVSIWKNTYAKCARFGALGERGRRNGSRERPDRQPGRHQHQPFRLQRTGA